MAERTWRGRRRRHLDRKAGRRARHQPVKLCTEPALHINYGVVGPLQPVACTETGGTRPTVFSSASQVEATRLHQTRRPNSPASACRRSIAQGSAPCYKCTACGKMPSTKTATTPLSNRSRAPSASSMARSTHPTYCIGFYRQCNVASPVGTLHLAPDRPSTPETTMQTWLLEPFQHPLLIAAVVLTCGAGLPRLPGGAP